MNNPLCKNLQILLEIILDNLVYVSATEVECSVYDMSLSLSLAPLN